MKVKMGGNFSTHHGENKHFGRILTNACLHSLHYVFLVKGGGSSQPFKIKFQLKWLEIIIIFTYWCRIAILMLRGWFDEKKWDISTLKAVLKCGVGLFSECWMISNRIWTFGTKKFTQITNPPKPMQLLSLSQPRQDSSLQMQFNYN